MSFKFDLGQLGASSPFSKHDLLSLRHRIAPCKVTMRCSDTLTQEDVLAEVVLSDEWHIVLFNDNHNTFDHVIDCLMEVCGHDALQAEQCAMIVHFKGKCTVKSGDYEELAPIQKSLSEKDLTVELNP